MNGEWKVLRHGDLMEVVPGSVWSVQGSNDGMPLPRAMVLVKLGDGGLLVHSPVCLDDERMAELEGIGKPRILLVPNQGHRLDIQAWKARYPEAKVVCPANARAKVEEVIRADATCEEALPAEGIVCHAPPGFKPGYELIYEVTTPSGKALLVNDVLGNLGPARGFAGMFLGLLGVPGGGFGRPRIVSFRFGTDRAAFKPFVEGLAARDDLVAITVSHGAPVIGREQVREKLTAAAAKL